MYASLRLECIGDNHIQEMRAADKFSGGMLGGSGMSGPWVARLTGLDMRRSFRREFVRGQKDYTAANSNGSRGIYLYFQLPPGVYEVFERTAWQNTRRYFVRSEGGTTAEITRAEVVAHFVERGDRDHPDPFPG